jgi:hypothetical protein
MVHATVKRESPDSFTVTFDKVTTLNNKRVVPVPSASKSVAVPAASASSNPAASKPISAASSGTNQLEAAKAIWKKVVEEVNRDIQVVSTYAATDLQSAQRALEEAGKLSTKLTVASKVIEGVVKNEEKHAVSEERKGITEKIGRVFAIARKMLNPNPTPKPTSKSKLKKGGRRTRRKRAHRKRTHRNPRKRSLKVLSR